MKCKYYEINHCLGEGCEECSKTDDDCNYAPEFEQEAKSEIVYETIGNLAKQISIATLREGEKNGYTNESVEAICMGQYDKGRDWLAHAVTHIMADRRPDVYGVNGEDHLAHALTDIVCEIVRREIVEKNKEGRDCQH